jgi:chromosome segregation ATPase
MTEVIDLTGNENENEELRIKLQALKKIVDEQMKEIEQNQAKDENHGEVVEKLEDQLMDRSVKIAELKGELVKKESQINNIRLNHFDEFEIDAMDSLVNLGVETPKKRVYKRRAASDPIELENQIEDLKREIEDFEKKQLKNASGRRKRLRYCPIHEEKKQKLKSLQRRVLSI